MLQSPNKDGRKKKVKGEESREIRSSLSMLDLLKDSKFKIQESKKKARVSINCMF